MLILLVAPVFYSAQDEKTEVPPKGDKREGPVLEVTASGPVEAVRGGEKLVYTFTVKNLSEETATDITFSHEIERGFTFVSASISQGKVVTYPPDSAGRRVTRLECSLGDITGYASVILTVEAKLDDWGDISRPGAVDGDLPQVDYDGSGPLGRNKRLLRDLAGEVGKMPAPDARPVRKYSEGASVLAIPLPWIQCQYCSEDQKRQDEALYIEILPSKNIPPRIEILSPKPEAVFVRPVLKQIEVPIRMKIFDPDGRIKKVVIHDNFNPQFQVKMEDGVYKYVIAGKTYTQEEVEARSEDEEFRKLTELRIVPAIGEIYIYTARRFSYYLNRVYITATDNGGRTTHATAEFKVKSDSAIELVKPVTDVFLPGSTVTVETVSKVSPGVTPKVTLGGTNGFYEVVNPEMQMVSRTGNTYIHRFTWKVGKEGLYDLTPKLLENGEDTNVSDWFRTVAALPRVIKVASPRNGQTFARGERITVSTLATDINGKEIFDKLELLVDGKLNGDIPISQKYEPGPPYKIISTGYADRYVLDLQPGVHTLQVIAKHEFGTKLGTSAVVTIRVSK